MRRPTLRLRAKLKKGLTMVETMVSLFLVLAGVLLGLSLYSASNLINRQSAVRTVAYSVARQQLEQLRSYSYSNRVAVTDAPFPISAEAKKNFPDGAKGLKLEGTYTISPVVGSTSRQQVTVQITWRYAGSTNLKEDQKSNVTISAIVAQQEGFALAGGGSP